MGSAARTLIAKIALVLTAGSTRCGRIAGISIVALILTIGAPARAEMWLEQAFPKDTLKGPAAAQGALIWSHGNSGHEWEDEAALGPDLIAALLRDEGWDVFLFKRTFHEIGRPHPQAVELEAQVARLVAQGYRKIVLGGQSQGAWISIMAASESANIYAVIANAPATYGTDHPRYEMNASELYPLLEDVRRARTMISYFRDDPFDPGGRGPRSEDILARHDVAHLIVDQPVELSGHGAGEGGLFYRRLSPCIVSLVGDGPMPELKSCESHWGEAPSGDVPLPVPLSFKQDAQGPSARFIGTWWGTYSSLGREVILAVTNIVGTRAEAVYAVGPMPMSLDKGGYSRRVGLADGDTLEFANNGRPTLRYRMNSDGTLQANWIATDGRSTYTTVLRKLPP